jgi:hypothetical protein
VQSCSTSEKREKTKKQALITNVSILISGRGREIVKENTNTDSIIDNDLSREIYLIELTKDGELKTSLGYGFISSIENSESNNLKMNLIEKKDSLLLTKNKLKHIFKLASEIHTERAYHSNNIFMDSWLIKLKINNKTNIFFLGETAEPFNKLREEYLTIVDELVKVSAIRVRGYR